MFGLNKYLLIALAVLGLALAGSLYVAKQQYTKATLASARADAAENALADAQKRVQARLEADIKTENENRALRDSVGQATRKAKHELRRIEAKTVSCPDLAVSDVEWGGVFERALEAANSGISTAAGLPEAVR